MLPHISRPASATSSETRQNRKGLREVKAAAAVPPSPPPPKPPTTIAQPLVIRVNCGDWDRHCDRQRAIGNCSTNLLRNFHTCLATCGVCPALEQAMTGALGLSRLAEAEARGNKGDHLVVAMVSGPPPCRDQLEGCSELLGEEVVAAGCKNLAARVVGMCRATCRACYTKPLPVFDHAGEHVDDQAAPPPPPAMPLDCYDAADMCGYWAATGMCIKATGDVQKYWWLTVACRRSCGLCGPANATAPQGGASVSTALAAAARWGVQVGEGADGTPRVAVFTALPKSNSACLDKEPKCAEWRDAGECEKNADFMAKSCPASCGSCPVSLNLPDPLATLRLNNGVRMPTIGYGSAALTDRTDEAVGWALKAGYRHIDSAQAREWYREDLVGKALQAFLERHQATVRREDIFITSKLHPRHHGFKSTLRQMNQTLVDLHTGYVDLFLLHYPECWGDLCGGDKPEGTYLDSWRALEKMYEAGIVRAIGVSNFSPSQLQSLIQRARVKPQILQVNVDPLNHQDELQELCRTQGIALTAYSTLGTQYGGAKNPVLTNPVLMQIGEEAEGRSTAQVSLRWALQQGLVVLPRSSNQGRIALNLQMYDWSLTPSQMQQIASLRRT